jgi:hypothetical protein
LKKFVKKIAKMYASDEAAAQEFMKFHRLRDEPGWTEMVRMIHITRGFMAQEMLGDKFTNLSEKEKDIKQRVYAGLQVFLNFWENPSEELEKAMYLAGHEKVVKDLIRKRNLKAVAGRK